MPLGNGRLGFAIHFGRGSFIFPIVPGRTIAAILSLLNNGGDCLALQRWFGGNRRGWGNFQIPRCRCLWTCVPIVFFRDLSTGHDRRKKFFFIRLDRLGRLGFPLWIPWFASPIRMWIVQGIVFACAGVPKPREFSHTFLPFCGSPRVLGGGNFSSELTGKNDIYFGKEDRRDKRTGW